MGSVPLRGTCRLIAKEDGSGEPDPVERVSEAVHCDGAHGVLLSVADTDGGGGTAHCRRISLCAFLFCKVTEKIWEFYCVVIGRLAPCAMRFVLFLIIF